VKTFVPIFWLATAAATFAGQPSLTIYNQNFAVVREEISIPVEKGISEITFAGITAHLEPDSVILRDPKGRVNLRILEQNYRNDPVSQELLLQYFEGQELEFEVQRGSQQEPVIVKGKLVRAPYVAHTQAMQRLGPAYAMRQTSNVHSGNSPIVEIDGKLRFQLPGMPLFPALSDDSILKPTLHWKLESDQAVKSPLELSYVSGGFTWSADYNLLLPEKGNTLTMVGWITLENQSGRTFTDAQVKLMAGDVNKLSPQQGVDPRLRRENAFAMAAAEPVVTEQAFDEYHLYTLALPTTVRDREVKQVEFLRAEGIKSRQLFVYNGSAPVPFRGRPSRIIDDQNFGMETSTKVEVYREFENSQANQLGLPLPKGRIRFYRSSEGGQLEFIGENMIDHTPRNEMLRIYTGAAFDLVGERIRTDFQMNTNTKQLDESFTIKVRNRKDEAVQVLIVEELLRWLNWDITTASEAWKKVDTQRIEFLVDIPADTEKVVSYSVRYSW